MRAIKKTRQNTVLTSWTSAQETIDTGTSTRGHSHNMMTRTSWIFCWSTIFAVSLIIRWGKNPIRKLVKITIVIRMTTWNIKKITWFSNNFSGMWLKNFKNIIGGKIPIFSVSLIIRKLVKITVWRGYLPNVLVITLLPRFFVYWARYLVQILATCFFFLFCLTVQSTSFP